MNSKGRVLKADQLTSLRNRYPVHADLIHEVFDTYAERHRDPIGQTDLALRASMENNTDPRVEMLRDHTA